MNTYFKLSFRFSLFLCFIFIFSACSVFQNNDARSVEIKNINKIANEYAFNLKQAEGQSFYHLSGVIKDSDIFFSAITDCRTKGTSLQSLVRQILVGFDKPVITLQHAFTVNNVKLLRSFIKTSYKKEELNLIIYTTEKDKCINDYAFWSTVDLQALEGTQEFKKLDRFVTELIQKNS